MSADEEKKLRHPEIETPLESLPLEQYRAALFDRLSREILDNQHTLTHRFFLIDRIAYQSMDDAVELSQHLLNASNDWFLQLRYASEAFLFQHRKLLKNILDRFDAVCLMISPKKWDNHEIQTVREFQNKIEQIEKQAKRLQGEGAFDEDPHFFAQEKTSEALKPVEDAIDSYYARVLQKRLEEELRRESGRQDRSRVSPRFEHPRSVDTNRSPNGGVEMGEWHLKESIQWLEGWVYRDRFLAWLLKQPELEGASFEGTPVSQILSDFLAPTEGEKKMEATKQAEKYFVDLLGLRDSAFRVLYDRSIPRFLYKKILKHFFGSDKAEDIPAFQDSWASLRVRPEVGAHQRIEALARKKLKEEITDLVAKQTSDYTLRQDPETRLWEVTEKEESGEETQKENKRRERKEKKEVREPQALVLVTQEIYDALPVGTQLFTGINALLKGPNFSFQERETWYVFDIDLPQKFLVSGLQYFRFVDNFSDQKDVSYQEAMKDWFRFRRLEPPKKLLKVKGEYLKQLPDHALLLDHNFHKTFRETLPSLVTVHTEDDYFILETELPPDFPQEGISDVLNVADLNDPSLEAFINVRYPELYRKQSSEREQVEKQRSSKEMLAPEELFDDISNWDEIFLGPIFPREKFSEVGDGFIFLNGDTGVLQIEFSDGTTKQISVFRTNIQEVKKLSGSENLFFVCFGNVRQSSNTFLLVNMATKALAFADVEGRLMDSPVLEKNGVVRARCLNADDKIEMLRMSLDRSHIPEFPGDEQKKREVTHEFFSERQKTFFTFDPEVKLFEIKILQKGHSQAEESIFPYSQIFWEHSSIDNSGVCVWYKSASGERWVLRIDQDGYVKHELVDDQNSDFVPVTCAGKKIGVLKKNGSSSHQTFFDRKNLTVEDNENNPIRQQYYVTDEQGRLHVIQQRKSGHWEDISEDAFSREIHSYLGGSEPFFDKIYARYKEGVIVTKYSSPDNQTDVRYMGKGKWFTISVFGRVRDIRYQDNHMSILVERDGSLYLWRRDLYGRELFSKDEVKSKNDSFEMTPEVEQRLDLLNTIEKDEADDIFLYEQKWYGDRNLPIESEESPGEKRLRDIKARYRRDPLFRRKFKKMALENPKLFLQTFPAEPDSGTAAQVEYIFETVFPELAQAAKLARQERDDHRAAFGSGGSSGFAREGAYNGVFDGSEGLEMLQGGDPLQENGQVLVESREPITEHLILQAYTRWNDARGTFEVGHPPHFSPESSISTQKTRRMDVYGLSKVRIACAEGGEIVLERIKGIRINDRFEEEEVEVRVSRDGSGNVIVDLDKKQDIQALVYSEMVPALPPIPQDISDFAYRQFRGEFLRNYGTDMTEEMPVNFPAEWLDFIDSLKPLSPQKKVLAIQHFVRSQMYYDMENREVRFEKTGKPLQQQADIMAYRMKRLKILDASIPGHKQFAGVCHDSAVLTVALLRRAGFVSGHAMIFQATGRTNIKSHELHATACVVWPHEHDPKQYKMVLVDGTPMSGSGEVEHFALPDLDSLIKERREAMQEVVEAARERVQEHLEALRVGGREAIQGLQNGSLERALNTLLLNAKKQNYHVFERLFALARYGGVSLQETDGLRAVGEQEILNIRHENHAPEEFAGSELMHLFETYIGRYEKDFGGEKAEAIETLERVVQIMSPYLLPDEDLVATAILKSLKAKHLGAVHASEK